LNVKEDITNGDDRKQEHLFNEWLKKKREERASESNERRYLGQ